MAYLERLQQLICVPIIRQVLSAKSILDEFLEGVASVGVVMLNSFQYENGVQNVGNSDFVIVMSTCLIN